MIGEEKNVQMRGGRGKGRERERGSVYAYFCWVLSKERS